MINHRNKQNYRFRTWKFRDRCHLTGGVRQGCFLSLILNNLIQYIHFHSLYITSHYYAKFKENPCVGTDARPPLRKMPDNNPNLNLLNMNAYIKFGEILLICPKYIEQKRNSDKNQGPYFCYKFAKNGREQSQPTSCQHQCIYKIW